MIIEKVAKNLFKNAKYSVESHTKPTGTKAVLIVSSPSTSRIDYELAKLAAANSLPVYLAGNDIGEVISKLSDDGIRVSSVALDNENPPNVKPLFQQIERDGCYVDLVIYNPPPVEPVGFLEITEKSMMDAWTDSCLLSFYIAQAALEQMLPRGRGTLILGGASTSRRGEANNALNSTTKAGLRLMAQSVAREFSSKGIHVVHAVLDDKLVVENSITPEIAVGIVKTYWELYEQHITTWTHELDLVL